MSLALDQVINKALAAHNSGDLVEAHRLYIAVLQVLPRHSGVNYNLGLIKTSANDPKTALPYFKIALEEDPNNEIFWVSYVQSLIKANQITRAKKYLKRAMKEGVSAENISIIRAQITKTIKVRKLASSGMSSYPSDIQLEKMLTSFNSGDLRASEELAMSTSKQYPHHPLAWKLLGAIYQRTEDLEKGLISIENAVDIDPKDHEVHHLMAAILHALGRIELSIISYRIAISLAPNASSIQNNLGVALQKLGKMEEAKLAYEKEISLENKSPDAFNNLGTVLRELGDYRPAEVLFKQAITLRPNFPEAHNNLGTVLDITGRLNDAADCFIKAISLRENYVSPYHNLAIVSEKKKDLEGALNCYEKVLLLAPETDFVLGAILHIKMQLGIWDNFSHHVDTLVKGVTLGKNVSSPFPLHSLIDNPEIQKISSESYCKTKFSDKHSLPILSQYRGHDKIRIGYFSPDFKNHPVAHLIAGLFEHHDRSNFEIHAFSFDVGSTDEFTDRIKSGVDYFHQIQTLSDKQITLLSRSLEIDIAVDLVGFTAGCRPNIFAMKAAPIQIGYLGFLGTMGADYYEYIIADTTIIPEKNKKHYSEKIIYLPCYQVNDSKVPIVTGSQDRENYGIPQDVFVFCCFNNLYKITPNTFDSWARILQQVDQSVLFLYSDNQTAIKNLKSEMSIRGIRPSRLIFGGLLPRPQYLARYYVTDLFLDTSPYNSGATASDALRMGLPVLTCLGDSFASRMAASILKSVGMHELIATTTERYESLAVEIATNPDKLMAITKKLKQSLPMSQLYNTADFTYNLEQSYSIIYAKYLENDYGDHVYCS